MIRRASIVILPLAVVAACVSHSSDGDGSQPPHDARSREVLTTDGGRAESQADPGSSDATAEPWTDPSSGFTWQVAPSGGPMDWYAAKIHCSDLDLEGGGWRLPSISELRTLIRGCPATEAGGSCSVQDGGCLALNCGDSSCDGCSDTGGPSGGCYWPDEMQGECTRYWSSSREEEDPFWIWYGNFASGMISRVAVYNSAYARCVR